MSAELKCSDGTIIKISEETEKELRKAFGKPEVFNDGILKISVNPGGGFPICIGYNGSYVIRTVAETVTIINVLQNMVDYVDYCERCKN